MATYQKNIPKHPSDGDETLQEVLQAIVFHTKYGDKLVKYTIESKKVILDFEELEEVDED